MASFNENYSFKTIGLWNELVLIINIISLLKEGKDKDGIRQPSHKDEAKKQEYLLLNYPADVRRNLRSISNLNFGQDDKPKKSQEKEKVNSIPSSEKQAGRKGLQKDK